MNVDTAHPDDTWHLSASNIGKALAAPALENWGYEQTATKVLDQIDVIKQLLSADYDAAWQYVKKLRFQKPDGELSASKRGTYIHEYIEARLLGNPTPAHEPHVVEQLRPYLERVEDWLVRWQPRPILVEQVVLNPEHRLAGRLDFVLEFPRWQEAGLDGPVALTDAKTHEHAVNKWGRVTKPYGNPHALQLSTYRHATHVATWDARVLEQGRGDRKSRFYLANAAELATATAMPEIHGTVILHVTPGHAHIHKIESGPDVYNFARNVAEAWRFVNVIADRTVGDALTLEVQA